MIPKGKTMKLGICTGGGDCPGLNSAIRAMVTHGIRNYGMEFFGIRDCLKGLFTKPCRFIPLHLEQVSSIFDKGGTILGTENSGNPLMTDQGEAYFKATKQGFEDLGLDALVIIGGEGTQGMCAQLSERGLPVIGIPKTIDYDLPGTEETIGFSTCIDVVTDAVERLQSTAESHDRLMVLEVMGRDSGFIALHGGLAGGAHVILIPEIEFDIDVLVQHINERKAMGWNYSVLVVSEGSREKNQDATYLNTEGSHKRLGGIGQRVAEKLEAKTHMETRVTVLGHIQRGGSPNARDRIIASEFAVYAVDLAAKKQFNQLVVRQENRITHISYSDIIYLKRRKIENDDVTLKTAESMGISFGRQA